MWTSISRVVTSWNVTKRIADLVGVDFSASDGSQYIVLLIGDF